jgi:putative ATPase
MKEAGYGKGYQYAHDYEDKLTPMSCLPDSLEGRVYYDPTTQGLESKFKERLENIKAWKEKHRND